MSYVDADFANSIADRHSVSGYVVSISVWRSYQLAVRTQPTVAIRSMESEYMASSALPKKPFG